MTSNRLIEVLTIGANLAVLVGLLFVGLEMRTNRAAAQAQIADGIAAGYLDLNMAAVSDPAVACIWSVGLEAPARLTDLEAARFSWFMRGIFNQYMRVQALYETGLYSEASWSNAASTASWLMSTPGGQIFFQENALPQDFVEGLEPHAGVAQDFLLGRELPEKCP